jgi:hypothetical protein
MYRELVKRGNRDGSTQRLRELEAIEKTERAARQTPRCDVFTSQSLAHWPQRHAGARRPSADQAQAAAEHGPDAHRAAPTVDGRTE